MHMKLYNKKSKKYAMKYCNNCTYEIFVSCPYKNGGDCSRMGVYTSRGISQDEIDELIALGKYTKEEIYSHLEKHYVKTENNMYLSTIEMKDRVN